MKKIHKVLAVVLAVIMTFSAFSVLPITANAAESESVSVGAYVSGDFEYQILDDGTAEITRYTGSETDLVIPSELNGYKVSGISYGSFSDCSDIISITIPESISSIDYYAFNGCVGLVDIFVDSNNESFSSNDGVLYDKSATILIKYPSGRTDKNYLVPDFVTSIGKSAFYSCNSLEYISMNDNVEYVSAIAFYKCPVLKKVILGKGIKSIESHTFAGCNALESIDIPENVSNIYYEAFYECPSIAEINVDENNTGYSSNDGVLYSKDATKLLQYPVAKTGADFTVPESVTVIGSNAFRDNSYIESVVISDSVTVISDCAFQNCANLKTAAIGNSVTKIDSSAFIYCKNLTSITIPDGVTEIGKYSFLMCSNLKDLKIGKGITEIPDEAFSDCNSLISVVIPDNITKIGNWAFENCMNLLEITIPDSVTSIGRGAFKHCQSLANIKIPEKVTEIGSEAFIYTDLTEIIIPESVASIGIEAFPSSDGFTVYGYKGTAAQEYAEKYGLIFLTVPEKNKKFIDSATGVAVSGTLSDDLVLSVKKIDDYDNDNILCEYKISLITPDNVVFKNHKLVEVSIPGDELGCKVLSIDDDGVYHFVNSEYADGYYVINTESLSTYALSKALSVGEVISLDGMVSAFDTDNINWNSSDNGIARVSANGTLTAVNPGVVTITATDDLGKYTAEETFTVAGDKFELPEYDLISLDNGEIEYTSSSVECKQIPCEQLNGIYFLKRNELSFYSLTNNKQRHIFTFDGCTNAYSANDNLYVVYKDKIRVYDLLSQKITSEINLTDYKGNAVGADSQGRIYVAATKSDYSDNKLFLYSSDGELLSQTDTEGKVYNFNGFDSTNGNFYMESYYNWIYWGYSHNGKAITMGNVTDNVIKTVETSSTVNISILTYYLHCIEYTSQKNIYEHRDNAVLLGDKYLVTASVPYGRVKIIDSNSKDLDECIILGRKGIEYELAGEMYDTSSVGVRAVYNEAHESIIVYENGKILKEYDPETGKELASFNTKHYVFNLLKMGDNIIAIEKEDNQYYMEIVNWSDPEEVFVVGEAKKMKAGETQQLSVETGKNYLVHYDWSSSDNSILSVTSSGRAVAWKEGTAVVTCTSSDGKFSANYTITVTASDIVSPNQISTAVNGIASNNVSDNNYNVYGSVVKSYLYENEDNTLTRVEYIGEKKIIVETYSSDCELLDSKIIDSELPYFGGFFSGEDANYIVFGQKNENESDDCEVIRIVKYSKDWERLGECSYKGANTYEPFDAGSLRMTETNGMLYIYTCHTMYKDSGNMNHQSNMTFVIDEATMTVSQTYYDVMNISQAGYVSHSFNQFVKSDGKYVYRVDHGDYQPRAVSITRCETAGSIEKVVYTYALPINSTVDDNATGVSVGGFELSSDNCLIVGNTVDQSNSNTYDVYGQRNIFLTVTKKSLNDTNKIMLTNYTEDDNIKPRTPQLVKLDDDHFLIMWEEYNQSTGEIKVKMVTVDGDGTITSDIVTKNIRLSDCQPIVTKDGLVKWYTTNGNEVTMYTVNPYDFKIVGDINGDGKVSVLDATEIQKYLAGTVKFDDGQKAVGDVNGDGVISVTDATVIQKYIVGLVTKLG